MAWRQTWKLASLGFCALVIIACSARPQAYNVTVALDESLKDAQNEYPTFQVDLRAISEAEKGSWEAIDVLGYFAKPDSYSYQMKFSNEQAEPSTLEADDDKWEQWKGRPYLVVLTDLPVAAGNPPRRLIVPLWTSCWDSRVRHKDEPIMIMVGTQGLRLETPMKPNCP